MKSNNFAADFRSETFNQRVTEIATAINRSENDVRGSFSSVLGLEQSDQGVMCLADIRRYSDSHLVELLCHDTKGPGFDPDVVQRSLNVIRGYITSAEIGSARDHVVSRISAAAQQIDVDFTVIANALSMISIELTENGLTVLSGLSPQTALDFLSTNPEGPQLSQEKVRSILPTLNGVTETMSDRIHVVANRLNVTESQVEAAFQNLNIPISNDGLSVLADANHLPDQRIHYAFSSSDGLGLDRNLVKSAIPAIRGTETSADYNLREVDLPTVRELVEKAGNGDQNAANELRSVLGNATLYFDTQSEEFDLELSWKRAQVLLQSRSDLNAELSKIDQEAERNDRVLVIKAEDFHNGNHVSSPASSEETASTQQ